MGLDLRYLVVTLVGVFLALALGMVIGGVVMGEEGLTARHDALVTHLEAEFERLRAENRRQRVEMEALREELVAGEALLQGMVGLAVTGKLAGQRVAVVATAGETPSDSVARVLRVAGAELISVTRITADIEPGDFARRVEEALSADDAPPRTLAEAVAGMLLHPEQAHRERLAAAGLVTVDGDYRQSPTTVLLLGGSRSASQARATEIDLPLADALRRGGLRVVGAETGGASVSYTEHYLRAGIPCLDHLDSPAGLVSLVYLVAGDPGPLGRRIEPPALLPRGDWP
ncbi:MAG: copper transporter [bacterium]|nr:copper transporter [bacterium]